MSRHLMLRTLVAAALVATAVSVFFPKSSSAAGSGPYKVFCTGGLGPMAPQTNAEMEAKLNQHATQGFRLVALSGSCAVLSK